MNHLKTNPCYLGFLLFLCVSTFALGNTTVTNLVCEYHTNPIGIDIVKPRFSWQISTTESNVKQKAYEIRVAGTPENLGKKSSLWNSGKIEADQSLNVEYQGTPLKSMQRAYWQVRIWDGNNKATDWSKPAYWETGILDSATWTAKWITMPNGNKLGQCYYFRNEFLASKKISKARVYVTSLGLYQLYLNGKKVSDDLFTPGWTSYNKRLQYQTYDVTGMLQKVNTIGAIIGEGWYGGRLGWVNKRNIYGKKLALLVQMKIDYTDGTSQTIVSDKNWKASEAPILQSSIYDGETYDARLEKRGWSTSGFDDGNWAKAAIIEHPKGILVAPQGVPVKAIQEIIPIKMLTTPKGETVFDMGQNMVGWVRLKVNGKKGDKVTLKFAEVLDKEGNFYLDNMRSAKVTDEYILSGNGNETFEPCFTFHGFRFVKIEGFPGKPKLSDITGVVIYSEMKPTGTFSCSDSLINKLQKNIQWGQKGNYLDVPTDCPQRDERLGWTGDAQVFCMTAAYNFDVSAFYTKWLKDMAADQLPDGKIPNVIPDVILDGKGGSTAWGDVCVVMPWTVYKIYGDKRILEEQYKSMKAWVEFMRNRAGNDYIWTGDNHFGDWLAFATIRSDYPGATTGKDIICNAYFYYTTNLVSKIASIIGQKADSEMYAKLAENVRKAFVQEFVTPKGRLVSETQTAYSLAISFGLLPQAQTTKVGEFLAADVEKMGHLTTGFVGTPLLCNALSSTGRDDLAFKLLNRKEYPSWLYPVTQGATTIWERWDGQKPDGTFQNPGMNSFNHYAYGAIGEWLYSRVAGLNVDPENPGYKHIIFSPHVGGGLTNAKAEFLSMYGMIKSGWEVKNKDFTYSVVIPANTTGTVILPNADPEKITLNALPLSQEMKKNMVKSSNGFTLELGSGSYQFDYQFK
ncbi:MAG: glycoside hydrolase family 78 protein [Bacteroidales bacterium]|nr:glycoside hydrolase family 78 protein [Bacteroidales bacterium]